MSMCCIVTSLDVNYGLGSGGNPILIVYLVQGGARYNVHTPSLQT
jgi:hypothetical protein